MNLHSRAALALGLAALGSLAWAGAASAAPPWRAPPGAGRRPYTYTMTETVNGKVENGLRLEFDLETDGQGDIDAVVRAGQHTSDGVSWSLVTAPDACLAAMHAPAGGLARVRLWPVAGGASATLGGDFLDNCAPDGVFLPLADILNVAVIQVSPQFRAGDLHRLGDQANYPGLAAVIDRTGRTMKETSTGGVVSLTALDRTHATLDWAPSISALQMTEAGQGGQTMDLQGTEHFAFRVVIERATGALVSAATTYDDLALTLHTAGVPPAGLPLKISRAVVIAPRP
jgi:hypothetical protein